jgi:hypothetical protein
VGDLSGDEGIHTLKNKPGAATATAELTWHKREEA